jgi:hypothetical protein
MAESDSAAVELTCPRCSGKHEIIACPHVKAIEFEDGDGQTIRRLEFLTPNDFPRADPRAAPAPDNYRKLGD